MKKLFEYPNGSSWRKWDLHIHSTYSKESSAKLTVKDIFENAIDNEISVVAITDHSNVEALDDVWDLHNSIFERDGNPHKYSDYINFIPGVELKTDKGNKPIHLIALFPQNIQKNGYCEKVDKNFLKTEFLSKINCSDSDIRAAGNGDYNKGLLEIHVDFEEACIRARELGGVTIVHNGSKSNGFDKGLSHSVKDPIDEEILTTFNTLKSDLMTNYVDICEIPTLNDSNKKDKEFYLKAFNKPFILCSDSHSEYKGEKFTWIKADPTFEGLKQIIFEPKYRIHLGDNPLIEPLHRIDKVSFNFPLESKLGDEEFCFSGKGELYFSPNLTCIIGGRGSGKSTLLNLIHEKLLPKQNRFFNEHKLELAENMLLSQCISIDDDDDEKYIEFLSQNEIEEFALDHSKFTKAIFLRLNKLDDSNELEKCSKDLFSLLKEFDICIQNYEQISELKKNKEDYSKELITNQKLVSSLQDEKYSEITNRIREIDEELQGITSSKEKLGNLIKEIEALVKKHSFEQNSSNLYAELYNKIITNISKELSILKVKEQYKEIIKHEENLQSELLKKRRELNDFLESRGLSGENLKDLSEANQNINRLNRNINDIEKQINKLAKEIVEFNPNKELKSKYEEKIIEMLKGLNLDLKKLNEHVKTIELKYVFNTDKAKEELLKKVISHFPKHEKFEKLRNIEKFLFITEPWEVSNQKDFLEAMQKEKTNTKTFYSLYEYFSDENNFQIYKLLIFQVFSDVEQFKMIRVFYDGKPLDKTSFGQRCTAAVVILLMLGNNPIIIDEPEAHLDSSLIANYLVDLIKESKLKRQIIFATHNANFVINGDAELIHFLETNNERKTEILNMTIEDINNREKLLMLEGGIRAFEQREKRYQYK